MDSQIDDLLKSNNLSVTESRKKILEIFFSSNGALAHGDIEKRTGEKFDRVTVYRTLQTFLEKGIIHTIPTADNAIRYAVCKDTCTAGHHHDNHVHFICSSCKTTTCLDDVLVPIVRLPEGFVAEEQQMVVTGVCKTCQ